MSVLFRVVASSVCPSVCSSPLLPGPWSSERTCQLADPRISGLALRSLGPWRCSWSSVAGGPYLFYELSPHVSLYFRPVTITCCLSAHLSALALYSGFFPKSFHGRPPGPSASSSRLLKMHDLHASVPGEILSYSLGSVNI